MQGRPLVGLQVEADQRLTRGDRLAPLGVLHVGAAERAVGLEVPGLQAERAPERGDGGARVLAVIGVDLGHREPQRRLPGRRARGGRGLREHVDQPLGAARLHQHAAQALGRLLVIGPQLERAREILGGRPAAPCATRPTAAARTSRSAAPCASIVTRASRRRASATAPASPVASARRPTPRMAARLSGAFAQRGPVRLHRGSRVDALGQPADGQPVLRGDPGIRLGACEPRVCAHERPRVVERAGDLAERGQGLGVVGRDAQDRLVRARALLGPGAGRRLHARELPERGQPGRGIRERGRLPPVHARERGQVARSGVQRLERQQGRDLGALADAEGRLERGDGGRFVAQVVAPDLAEPQQQGRLAARIGGGLGLGREVQGELVEVARLLEQAADRDGGRAMVRDLGERLLIGLDGLPRAVEPLLVQLADAVRGQRPRRRIAQLGQVLAEQRDQLAVFARLAQQALERAHRGPVAWRELDGLPVVLERLGGLAPLPLAQLAHLGRQRDARRGLRGGVELAAVHLEQIVPVAAPVVDAAQAGERGHERGIDLERAQEALLGRVRVADALVEDGARPVKQAEHELGLAGERSLLLEALDELVVALGLLGHPLERVQRPEIVLGQAEHAPVGVRRLRRIAELVLPEQPDLVEVGDLPLDGGGLIDRPLVQLDERRGAGPPGGRAAPAP